MNVNKILFVVFILLLYKTYFIHSKRDDIIVFNNNSIVDEYLIEILNNYFKEKYCVSFIILPNVTISENWYMLKKQRVIKKINTNFKATFNHVFYRPRRDFITEKYIKYCNVQNEGVIIFITDINYFNLFAFNNREFSPLWNSQAKIYIHLLFFIDLETQKQLFKIVEHLWHVYKLAHLIISCSTCSNIYKFIPTNRINNKWGELKPYQINEIMQNYERIEVDLMDLNGYPIRATMFPSVMAKNVENNKYKFEGCDPSVLDLMAEKMNFTKIVTIPPDGEQFGQRLPNGSFTGALGTLLTGTSDLIPIGFFSMDYNTRDIELLGANMGDDDLCAVVHRANIVPAWLAPVRYIGFDVCVLLAGVYIGLCLVWFLIIKYKPKHRRSRKADTSQICLNTFRLMLTTAIPRISEAACERIFLAFSMIAFVTLAGTFQGTLVTVYSTLFYFPNINTLKDLAETGLPLLTRFESFKNDIFTDESNHVRGKLKDMVQIYKDDQKINELIAEFGNVGGLIRRTSMDLDNDTIIYDKKGNLALHVVKECIRTYGIAYVITKDSPFLQRMHQIILRSGQAGLFRQWYSEMARNTSRCWGMCQADGSPQGNSENRPLSLEDLQLAAMQLICGLLISVIVFIVELLTNIHAM